MINSLALLYILIKLKIDIFITYSTKCLKNIIIFLIFKFMSKKNTSQDYGYI